MDGIVTHHTTPATAQPALDGSLTINEIIARWPQSIATLNALGIDTCCGGGEALRDVAAEMGTTEQTLIAAITPALEVAR